jgi:hypothetical protein
MLPELVELRLVCCVGRFSLAGLVLGGLLSFMIRLARGFDLIA